MWWLTISLEIEQLIKNCKSCIVVQPPLKPEPLTMTKMPPCWSKLNVDICGPFPDGWSIIGVIDAGSRWPEVFIVKSTVTSVIVKELEDLFINKGRPLEIATDNGPQFISHEFKEMCRKWGIKHHPVTPYYPQANSEVERFFKTILKTIRIAVSENKDWKQELKQFLLIYRNSPHATTGKSPAELMYGRSLRDTIPSLEPKPSEAYKQAEISDAKSKQTIKRYADKDQHLKESDIKIGDTVVVKQKRKNKFSTNFGSTTYVVKKRNKATLTLKNHNGKQFKRHTSAVRRVPFQTNELQLSKEHYCSSDDEFYDCDDGIMTQPIPEPVHQPPNLRNRIPANPLPDLPHDTNFDEDDEVNTRHSPPELTSSPVQPNMNNHMVRRSTRRGAGMGVNQYSA